MFHRPKPAHVFSPAVEQDDVISSAVGSFLDRLFGGDPIPLMNYLARHGKISDSDIDRLKESIVESQSESQGHTTHITDEPVKRCESVRKERE